MTAGDRQPHGVSDDRLRAAVEAIGGQARSVNRERASRLSQALAELAAGCRAESCRREATEIAHQIVGSAGTFGFSAVSALAGEIEQYLRAADLDDPDRLAVARDQVRRLQEDLAAEPDYQLDDDERGPTS